MSQVFLDALEKETQNPFFKPLCYLMYYSGIRVGEALALQWKDFNFECRYFLIYKSVTREYEIDEFGHKIGKSKNIIKATKTKESMSIDEPFDDFLRTKEQLNEFLLEFRKLKSFLTSKGVQIIHLFAAIPVAFAIGIGQAYNPNYDATIITYDYKQGMYIKNKYQWNNAFFRLSRIFLPHQYAFI